MCSGVSPSASCVGCGPAAECQQHGAAAPRLLPALPTCQDHKAWDAVDPASLHGSRVRDRKTQTTPPSCVQPTLACPAPCCLPSPLLPAHPLATHYSFLKPILRPAPHLHRHHGRPRLVKQQLCDAQVTACCCVMQGRGAVVPVDGVQLATCCHQGLHARLVAVQASQVQRCVPVRPCGGGGRQEGRQAGRQAGVKAGRHNAILLSTALPLRVLCMPNGPPQAYQANDWESTHAAALTMSPQDAGGPTMACGCPSVNTRRQGSCMHSLRAIAAYLGCLCCVLSAAGQPG